MTIKKLVILSLIISSIFLNSCKKDSDNQRPEFKLEQADSMTDEDYEIYSLVIDSLYSNSTIILHQQTSQVDEYFYSFNSFIDINSNIDSSLVDDFLLQNDSVYNFIDNFNCLDNEVVLISTSEIEYIFNGQDINNNWDEFYNVYPNSEGLVKLTRIGYNQNRTQAIFGLGNQYASLGGEGCLIYLEKINNNWTIVNVSLTWIS